MTMKLSWWLMIIFLIQAFHVSAADQELRIAMLLWRGETEAEAGFKSGLQELGYQTTFEIHDAAQDLSKLGAILRSINNNLIAYDYVYTFGTTVSRRAKVVIGGKLPQIFNIVTDPVGAGIVNSLDSPGPTIGGGSDRIGITRQLDEVGRMLTFKKLGFFFNPREKNSLITRDELHRYGKEKGFEVVDFPSPPVDRVLQRNLQMLSDSPDLVDAVYLAPDSYLSSEGALIGTKLREAKIVSITQIRSLIEHGVLIGIAGDYHELGRAVASIVDRHQQGMVFEKIPVAHFTNLKLLMNKSSADLLGLELDGSLPANAELVD
ncbi:MAG: ABC transporter substrate-binding protein [Desulfofustis sp.]|nr:ABC transporter substrate-binding protein [Desulfofustis sp.]